MKNEFQAVYDRAECLYTREEVDRAVDEMAKQITLQLGQDNPLVLPVMIGALIPAATLLLKLDFPLEVHYIHATRYRSGTEGTALDWKMRPDCSLKDRTILVVDDILDKGLTLAAILAYCKEQGAHAVYSAVLLDKHVERDPQGTAHADFAALEVEDRYVFGYGMDHKEYGRNAPGIFAVRTEDE